MEKFCAKCTNPVTEVSKVFQLCMDCLELKLLVDMATFNETIQHSATQLHDMVGVYEIVANREMRLWQELAKATPKDEYQKILQELFKHPINPEELH